MLTLTIDFLETPNAQASVEQYNSTTLTPMAAAADIAHMMYPATDRAVVTQSKDGDCKVLMYRRTTLCTTVYVNNPTKHDPKQKPDISAKEAMVSADLVDALTLLYSRLPGPSYRHTTRGGNYRILIPQGVLQTKIPLGDDTVLITYLGENGRVWHRTVSEFTDGRFVSVV